MLRTFDYDNLTVDNRIRVYVTFKTFEGQQVHFNNMITFCFSLGLLCLVLYVYDSGELSKQRLKVKTMTRFRSHDTRFVNNLYIRH